MSRHYVNESTTTKGHTVGDYLREQAASAKDADPNTKSHLGIEEHEASARSLADADQREPAIQAWHRAAIGHARAGNTAGVIAAILKAEHLANHNDFAPDIERKATAADGTEGDGEVIDDREEEAQPTAAVSAPATHEEVFSDNDPTEDLSNENL